MSGNRHEVHTWGGTKAQQVQKAYLGLVELQLGEASLLCLPVSLVCHPFVGPRVIGIYVSQWAGHLQGATPAPVIMSHH